MTDTIIPINTARLEDDLADNVVSMFDLGAVSNLFTKYRVEITFLNRVMGGVPQRPDIIESWLRQRVTGGDEEVRLMFLKTLDELGVDVDAGATTEELMKASRKTAKDNYANTFRRDSKGIFLGDYQIKAGMKESTAILYPYQEPSARMGPTKKAARSYLAERVFIDGTRVWLNRTAPDGTYLHIGHVTGPKGPRSTLSYFDYCETSADNHAKASFTVFSVEDCIRQDMWERILSHMERNGIGAIRSMGYGQFAVTGFEKL